jgi:hypothetical protein
MEPRQVLNRGQDLIGHADTIRTALREAQGPTPCSAIARSSEEKIPTGFGTAATLCAEPAIWSENKEGPSV